MTIRLGIALVLGLLLGGCRRTGVTSEAGADAAADATAVTSEASPAPAATDVMSNASVSWDAGPAVVTSGEVDGASSRARNRAGITGSTK
jgi:hypothetical protein